MLQSYDEVFNDKFDSENIFENLINIVFFNDLALMFTSHVNLQSCTVILLATEPDLCQFTEINIDDLSDK